LSELKFIWLGLHSNREKEVFIEGFWVGIAATELMRKEAEQLERELANPESAIQYSSEKIQKRRDIY
jgi:broad specificity phosphatase PhoE